MIPMAKAKISLATVWADCPECGGSLSDPESGSLCIPVGLFDTTDKFTCDDCGKEFRLEAKAWK
jgi:uncharacterized protein with PIN domain